MFSAPNFLWRNAASSLLVSEVSYRLPGFCDSKSPNLADWELV